MKKLNLELIESFFITNLRLKNQYSPLFIIGTPRSATTLLFLYILNSRRFGFFPNISKWHPEAPIAYALDAKNHKYIPTYKNDFGILEGDYSPSDGWDIFNKYFPKYDLSTPVKENFLYELKNVYYFLEKIYHAPIANKNISSSIRIKYLIKLFPDALFLWIDREFVDNVFSLLSARKKLKVAKEHWWCTPPPQFYKKKFKSELERCVFQVYGIKKEISDSLVEVPKQQWLKIEYNEFCQHPQSVLNWLDKKYKNLQKRDVEIEQQFVPRMISKNERIPEKEQIQKILNQLPNGREFSK